VTPIVAKLWYDRSSRARALWCNGLISLAKLQEEATAYEQLKRQRYVDDEDISAPSE
jgi:hypothetical protein